LVRKWASGKTAAGPRSIARRESALPGIYALYNHPLFDLLRDREIGRRRITSLLSRFQNPSGQFPPWWFGDEFARLPELRFIPMVLRPKNETRRYRDHGFITSMPQLSKSAVFRVARLAPCKRAIEAIIASNWLIGRPVIFRAAPISA